MNVKANKGRLIIFEGVDASGKTTLCDELHRFLCNKGKFVNIFHFPGIQKGTLGELVYRIHHLHDSEFGLKTIDPCAIQLLHVAAHVDTIESKIKPALHRGEWVILDRFWWSTYIYGFDNGVQEPQLQYMINVEKFAWGTIIPDIIFLVDSEIPLRDDEFNSSAWQRRHQAYRRLAESEGKIQKCIRLETGKGDRVKCQALSKIQESVVSLDK